MDHQRSALLALALALAWGGAGCSRDGVPAAEPDLRAPVVDDAGRSVDLAAVPDLLEPQNACGDHEPTCAAVELAPPFPLHTDPRPDPAVNDTGVRRDPDGRVVLDGTARPALASLWVANAYDLANAGTVSKYSVRDVREVARYRSVTCGSLPTGSTEPCDGTRGCCALDDWNRYKARQGGNPTPAHQAILRSDNLPGRIALDARGDAYVANQAFGGQSSITRIAATVDECVDRNGNGRIDTSSDVNGDGFIATDCNGNGVPDSLADVQGTPCTNQLAQEFFDLDDECVLWTTNVFLPGEIGRGVVSVPRPGGRSVLWAVAYIPGTIASIDPDTGLLGTDARLPADCHPYMALADAAGIVWTTPVGGGTLCWFDEGNPAALGSVRSPIWGRLQGLAISIDRAQNIWTSYEIARYTPDRSQGTSRLGNGWWTRLGDKLGVTIAADARSDAAYFVYSCNGSRVTQIPASTLPSMKMDHLLKDPGWPLIDMPCNAIAVDANQDVWGIDPALVTRARIDAMGAITPPRVRGPTMNGNVCPAGDSCKAQASDTLGALAGFEASRPTSAAPGVYYRVLDRAADCGATGRTTRWLSLAWEGVVPPGTSLKARCRAGDTPRFDPAGGPDWRELSASPAALDLKGTHLEAELLLDSRVPGVSPALSSVRVLSECVGP